MSASLRLVAVAFLLAAATLSAQDKKKPTTPSPDAGVSYLKAVYPILKDRCEPCHYAKDKKGGLDVTSYAAFMKGGKTKNMVVAGDPNASFLIKEIVGSNPPMPKNANPLTAPQIELITKWIKEGARNN